MGIYKHKKDAMNGVKVTGVLMLLNLTFFILCALGTFVVDGESRNRLLLTSVLCATCGFYAKNEMMFTMDKYDISFKDLDG